MRTFRILATPLILSTLISIRHTISTSDIMLTYGRVRGRVWVCVQNYIQMDRLFLHYYHFIYFRSYHHPWYLHPHHIHISIEMASTINVYERSEYDVIWQGMAWKAPYIPITLFVPFATTPSCWMPAIHIHEAASGSAERRGRLVSLVVGVWVVNGVSVSIRYLSFRTWIYSFLSFCHSFFIRMWSWIFVYQDFRSFGRCCCRGRWFGWWMQSGCGWRRMK